MRILTLSAISACLILAAFFSEGAWAKSLDASSTIVSVVVHPDAATVTREAAITLPAGASTVVFVGVPYELAIGAVEARVQPAQGKPGEGPVASRLKELRAARAALEVGLEALRAKLAMIKSYSAASPEKLGAEAKPLAPAEWGVAFDTIGAAYAKTGEELRAAAAKAQELDAEIAGLAGAGGSAKGGLARDIAIGVESRAGGPAKIRLSYRTDAASWKPAYDARLVTGDKGKKPSLELLRRAVVTQQTGEDWRDVALSVSTVGARRGAAAPLVVPQRVAFPQAALAAAIPEPRSKSAAVADGLAANQTVLKSIERDRAEYGKDEGAYKSALAAEATAELEATAYAATFKISGPASAPGDGSAKSFVLSSRQLEPKLAILASPGLDPTAYLEARIQNDDEAPLLPGQLSVQRDGVFVGVSRLPLVASGESANFGFGADDKVKVTRVPVKRKEKDPNWFGQTKTDTLEFKTSVKNLHDFPVSVSVVDEVPFSENSAIVVETLPQTTPPSEKQPDDRRGVMAWSFELSPGETRDIHLAYRLKWPADRDIVFEAAPAAR
jgi:uncharacterized protein (TIGR02231 family)